MRRLSQPEGTPVSRRLILLLACSPAFLTLACSSSDAPASVDPTPPEDRDRESWGVRLQLRTTDTRAVTVEAPYVTDHIDAQQTRADSGVVVTLADSTGQSSTRLGAHRLVVDHRQHTVALAGSVLAVADHQHVSVRSDTLRWDRVDDRLDWVDGAHVTLTTGSLSAGRVSGGSDLAVWDAVDVRSVFRDSASTDTIQIDGAAAQVFSGQSIVAHFDSIQARWRDRDVRAQAAVYDARRSQVTLSGDVVVVEQQRRTRADSVRIDLTRARIVAVGSIEVRGDLQVTAERLSEDEQGTWHIEGNPAEAADDGRRLWAPVLRVSGDMDTVIAAGGAGATRQDQRVEADSLILYRAADGFEATGAVRLESDDVQGMLTAHRMSASGGQSKIWGSARLQRPRGDSDLLLTADTLHLSEAVLSGTGAFRLHSPPRLDMRADEGVYQTDADSAHMHGATEFGYTDGDSYSRLLADSCVVAMTDGVPYGIDWPAALTGRLVDSEQTSWIEATSGTATLADEQLVSLELRGDVDVTHQGAGARLSRFTAQQMELRYGDSGVLTSVLAEGDVLVQTHLQGEGDGASVNEVRGNELEVDLEGGAVISVRVIDSVEGRFVPDKEDE